MLFSKMEEDIRYIINMTNSIIGVSILAMPWCFREVGIVLATLLLICGAVLTKWSCGLLLAATIRNSAAVLPYEKRSHSSHTPISVESPACHTTYEHLALESCGKWGKLLVEISTIGYLLGACIAYLVVMGDLLPQVALRIYHPPPQEMQTLRTFLLTVVALGVALPLSLMQRIESLVGLSAFAICFYCLLALKVLLDAILSGEDTSWHDLFLWRSGNFFAVLPIFATGLSCQTQVFVMYESLPEPSTKRMNAVISHAVNICFLLYWTVGFFGYAALSTKDIYGDALLNLESSWLSDFIKAMYVVTAAVSFPLCVFPCRRSVEMLLSNSVSGDTLYSPSLEMASSDLAPTRYGSAVRLRIITVSMLLLTLMASILIPNIETILNLSGSTMGSLICFILPAIIHLRTSRLQNLFTLPMAEGLWSLLQPPQRQCLAALGLLLLGWILMGMCLVETTSVYFLPIPEDISGDSREQS